MDSVLDEGGTGRRWFSPLAPRVGGRFPRLGGTRRAEASIARGAIPTSSAETLHALVGTLGARREHRRLCRSNAALAERNAELRLVAAQVELDAAAAGYVFLAGDSHAELLGHPAWAGRW